MKFIASVLICLFIGVIEKYGVESWFWQSKQFMKIVCEKTPKNLYDGLGHRVNVRSTQITCPPNEVIFVQFANYGQSEILTTEANYVDTGLTWDQLKQAPLTSRYTCGNSQTNCYSPTFKNSQISKSLAIVSKECTGKRNCTIEASNSIFGDPCPDVEKMLDVSYECVKGIRAYRKTRRQM